MGEILTYEGSSNQTQTPIILSLLFELFGVFYLINLCILIIIWEG